MLRLVVIFWSERVGNISVVSKVRNHIAFQAGRGEEWVCLGGGGGGGGGSEALYSAGIH